LAEDGTNAGVDDGSPFKVLKLANQVSEFGYAKTNGSNNTTLGVFNKIESHGPDFPVDSMMAIPVQSVDHSRLRDKYRTYIRLLPVKPLIDKLLETYFGSVNYHYYALDEGTFRDLYTDWQNISHAMLNRGPQELTPDLQFFPALLFQTLALALQFQPPDYDPSLDALKYLAGMSFDDVASEYSESGHSIATLLGVRHNTLVKVQARFLRTSFLKNSGMIPESWHSLSSTIRDAQEMGLHKPNNRRHPIANEKPEDILENLWHEQLRLRVWSILCIWDIHMATVLGRPTTIDSRDGSIKLPMDTPIPTNRRQVAPRERTDQDPPTPLTMVIWNAELAAPLWSISKLEKEDPHQNNFAKVEKMHELINDVALHCPPWFRSENPDTTFDSHPDCQWLPRARPVFQTGAAFTIMALHRPYIFTNSLSRTRALHAALDILSAQRKLFNLIKAKDYKIFSLVLNTFDAIVLVAAVFILHPLENRDMLDSTLQHFEWGMERFEVMGARNSLAKSALAILKGIHVRLKKALSMSKITAVPAISSVPSAPSSTTTLSMSSPIPHPAAYPYNFPQGTPQDSSSVSSSTPNSSLYTQPTISNLTETATTPVAAPWDSYSALEVRNQNYVPYTQSMVPLQPMHDLLSGLSTIGNSAQMIDPQLMEFADPAMAGACQFEGDFESNSFWGFMNNYNLT